MKLKNLCLAVSVALYASAAGSIANAADFKQTFQEASAAFKAGNFDQAGTLFEQAGDELSKKDVSKAAQIWANAAVANIKAEDFAEAAEIYEKILSSKAKLDSAKQLSFRKNLAFCYSQTDERALQIKAAEDTLKAIKSLSNSDKAELYATIGDAYRDLELYRLAIDAYKSALKFTPKKEDDRRAFILTAMGLSQGSLGEYQDAIENLNHANKLALKLKQDRTVSDTFSNLGILNWKKGDYKTALGLFKNAIDVEKKAQFERDIGVDYNNIGLVYKSIGNYPLAMDMFNQSADIAKQVKNVRDEGIAVVNRALVYRIQGDYTKAQSEYTYATSLFLKADFKEGLAGAYLGVGKMLEIQDNDQASALDYYTKALDIYSHLEMPFEQAQTLLQIGELYQKDVRDGKYVTQIEVPQVKGNQGAAAAFTKFSTSAVKTEEEEEEEQSVSAGMSFVADETEPLAQSKDEALTKSKEYIDKAFAIINKMNLKDMLWSAHQDLGFIDYQQGKLESAFEHYSTAINIVSEMFLDASEVEAFGEFMANKESLYKEAQAVCAALYDSTKDLKYVTQMHKYGDTLNNEIQKASAALSNLKFQDQKKQEKYEYLAALQKKIAEAQKNTRKLADVSEGASAEEKVLHEKQKAEAQLQAEVIKQAEIDYAKALKEWEEQYPGDAILFKSASRVDIPMIQENITPDQTVLLYTQLTDKLLITVIHKGKVTCTEVAVPKAKLDQIIRDDFVIAYTEGSSSKHPGFGRIYSKKTTDEKVSKQHLDYICSVLKELYGYYISPIEKEIEGSSRLYIVNDGFASQLPFGALVSSFDDNGQPNYLIEKYEIGVIRPSFIQSFKNAPAKKNVKKMLAIANPYNFNFNMPLLSGTIQEIANARKELQGDASLANISKELDIASEIRFDIPKKMKATLNGDATKTNEFYLEKFQQSFPEVKDIHNFNRPTESWLREQLANNSYEILYFSTHGMPYTNVLSSLMQLDSAFAKKKFDYSAFVKEYVADPEKYVSTHDKTTDYYLKSATNAQRVRLKYTADAHLTTNSPLNGFLFMSSEDDETSILDQDIPLEKDGLLTMDEILEMPDSYFANTQYVFLSACNTGVTYAPASLVADLDTQVAPEETQKALEKRGLVPGVDQVSFVDSFMRRGVKNVYGTYWFVDDAMSAELLTRFMTNLMDKNNNYDAVGAFNAAQRSIIKDGKAGNKIPTTKYYHPQHPFFWAAGAVFGK